MPPIRSRSPKPPPVQSSKTNANPRVASAPAQTPAAGSAGWACGAKEKPTKTDSPLRAVAKRISNTSFIKGLAKHAYGDQSPPPKTKPSR